MVLELEGEEKIDLSKIHILVVDDINLIKKRRQLSNLEKILEKLPAEKQNIVFTNRRSKETQSILDKILKTPTEIKVDKTKVDEAVVASESDKPEQKTSSLEPTAQAKYNLPLDEKALALMKKHHVFNDKTPKYLLIAGMLKNS